jgi:DNA replication protein DnaC
VQLPPAPASHISWHVPLQPPFGPYKYEALILDDIAYVKKTEMETSALFELIAHRYESGSLIITSNQPFSEWDSIFSDNMMTVAAIDRVVHHAQIIEIQGESYRKTQSLRRKTQG